MSQYEYVKLLVQEFHARIDMSLVNALGSLFVNDSDLKTEYEHKRSVELDIESAKQGKIDNFFLFLFPFFSYVFILYF